jgi:hypothetical protein
LPIFGAGPSGGSGGAWFSDPISTLATVAEIRVRAGSVIDAVQFVHVNQDGAVVEQPRHGGPGGTLETFPVGGARIFQISGRYGDLVDSMTITVKRPRIGAEGDYSEGMAFGGDGGAANFTYLALPGYEIVGVCGRAGTTVDAIGVVFRALAERPA